MLIPKKNSLHIRGLSIKYPNFLHSLDTIQPILFKICKFVHKHVMSVYAKLQQFRVIRYWYSGIWVSVGSALAAHFGLKLVTKMCPQDPFTRIKSTSRWNITSVVRHVYKWQIFKRHIITGDESCVCGYDLETKQQSSQWMALDEPRPKKARQSRSKVKTMLTVLYLFDSEGVVHHEYAPPSQTVTKSMA